MERFLSLNKTKRWVDYLPLLIENYNKTPHRSTGFAPDDIDKSNSNKVYNRLYPKKNSNKKPIYNVDDCVRTLIRKRHFSKGFRQN